MNIRIYDVVKDDTAVSYDDGKICLNKILEAIEKEEVTIDFAGIDFVITAFLNPVIGDLILQKGAGIMNKINIKNANKNIIDKIKLVKDGALLKRKDMD